MDQQSYEHPVKYISVLLKVLSLTVTFNTSQISAPSLSESQLCVWSEKSKRLLDRSLERAAKAQSSSSDWQRQNWPLSLSIQSRTYKFETTQGSLMAMGMARH